MNMSNRVLLVLHLLGAFILLLVNAKTYETDDAIIIEGKCNSIIMFSKWQHISFTTRWVNWWVIHRIFIHFAFESQVTSSKCSEITTIKMIACPNNHNKSRIMRD